MSISTIVVFVFLLCCVVRGFQSFARTKIGLLEKSKVGCHPYFRLHYKASKPNRPDNIDNEDSEIEPPSEASRGSVNLPQEGLIGYQPGSLFYKPIDIYDPLENTYDLPGEDGSPEKISAIEKRIAEKVEKLKVSGEWDQFTSKEFGKDPLRDVPLLQAVFSNIKAGKPFDSWGELAVTMFSVAATIVLLSVYLLGVTALCDSFVEWFKSLDFQIDF